MDEQVLFDGRGPLDVVVSFVQAIRRAGLLVPTGATVAFADALRLVGAQRRTATYWAARATLVRRPEDIETFDRVFDAFWAGRGMPAAVKVIREIAMAVDDEGADGEVSPGEASTVEPAVRVRYSAVETLRARDFAAYTVEDWREAARLVAALRVTADLRRARRRRPTSRRRGHLDLRASVRASLRTDGQLVRLSYRSPSLGPRRLVLLLDVSGSMDPYARGLLRFAQAAVVARAGGRVEVFALGTRLTRLTRELAGRDADAALARACQVVPDWSGGTRLGQGLGEFNDRWGVRGAARGAVIVILSDGWDRGEPADLAEQMARLRRVAHRVVWVNPLKASPGYAPLARGMAAALPYVDEFVEGHSLGSLDQLAEVVAGRQVMASRGGRS